MYVEITAASRIGEVYGGKWVIMIFARKLVSIIMTQEVERQLNRWEMLGVIIDQETRKRILKQAKNFVPATPSDSPLVSGGFGYDLPRSFDLLWEAYVPPETKGRYLTDEMLLRYSYGMEPSGCLRLVHFDTKSYQGLTPIDAQLMARIDGVRLAGIEVLEKLVISPNWATSWNGKNSPYPDASGIEFNDGNGVIAVPEFTLWPRGDRLDVFVRPADFSWSASASPTVHEC